MHTEEEKPNGGRDCSDVATSEGLLAPPPWMLEEAGTTLPKEDLQRDAPSSARWNCLWTYRHLQDFFMGQ